MENKQKQGEKKDNNILKRIMVIICAIVILLGSYIYIVTVANSVPVGDFVNQKLLGKSNSYVNGELTKEREGVTFSITNYVFDGYKLRIEYEISGNNKSYIKNFPYLLNSFVTINSEQTLVNEQEGILNEEENNLKGYAVFCLENKLNPFNNYLGQTANDLINVYKINLKFTVKFEDAIRSWEFDFVEDSSNVKNGIKKYKVNDEINNKKINYIIKTPIGIYLNADSDMNIIIEDEKGRQYKSNKYCNNVFEYEFEGYYDDVKWIKIIPYEQLEPVYNNLDITFNSDGSFSYSQDDEMEISNVSRSKQNTTIYYNTKYQVISTLVPVGDFKYNKNEVLNDGSCQLILDEELEDGTYSFQYISADKSLSINQNDSIKVVF